MTVKESILRNLDTLSPSDLVKVDSYIFRLSPAAQREQAEMLRATYGSFDDVGDEASEQAVNGAHSGLSPNDAASDETAYLMSSPANAKRLLESIHALENGQGVVRDVDLDA